MANFTQEDIDGGLVGGASLNADSFTKNASTDKTTTQFLENRYKQGYELK